jgi:membrane-associated PAP2 superfamily phosphatase
VTAITVRDIPWEFMTYGGLEPLANILSSRVDPWFGG